MKAKGLKPVLRNSRWSLLKRPENLTPKQEVKLADLVRYNLKTVRSYLLKEDFQFFWEYRSVGSESHGGSGIRLWRASA